MAIANQIFVFHVMDFERRQDLQSQCAPWQDVSIGDELLEYFMLIVVMDLSISIVIVCPSVRLGLTMVKFSYSLVQHRETAMYAVK